MGKQSGSTQEKLERTRLRRLAAESKNVDLQKQLLESEYADVLRRFEVFFLGEIEAGVDGDERKKAEVDARTKSEKSAAEWKVNRLSRIEPKKKPGETNLGAGNSPKKNSHSVRLDQHTAAIARVCSQIAELEREAGLTLAVGERSLEELLSRRSPHLLNKENEPNHAEETVTVRGSKVTVETLVAGKPLVQHIGSIARRPLWARHSAITIVVLEQEESQQAQDGLEQKPNAMTSVRKGLLEALSHVGIVLSKRSTRDSLVGQCILELGVPVVWFDADKDLASLRAAIQEEDQRSFTAGAMAEVRGALFHVDRIECEIEDDRQALQIRADEARARVMLDEHTPLPEAEALIKRLDERCARELDAFISWAGEQMRIGLNALESRIKLRLAQAPDAEVLSEPVADNARLTVKVSKKMIDELARMTAGSKHDGMEELQTELAKKSRDFWEKRLRDRIIQKSLKTLPEDALEQKRKKLDQEEPMPAEAAVKPITTKLSKESFRAVDDAAEERIRRVTIESFSAARDTEIVPVPVLEMPNAKIALGYMKKVMGSFMGAISSFLIVGAFFNLGINVLKSEVKPEDVNTAVALTLVLTLVVYIVAWHWAKRDYASARETAAEKLRAATLRSHSAQIAAFETAWHKNLSKSLKASLRDTLRRMKVDLRDEMAKLRVPKEVQRLERAKIAQHFESEIKGLSAAAAQAARLRAQLADQQKQMAKNLEQVLSQRGTP